MASTMHLLSLLVWAWMAGSVITAPSCENCEENGDSVVCMGSTADLEYQLKILYQGRVLQLQCEPSARTLNISLAENCSFPQVKDVEIHGCPLPSVSFGELFLQLGIYPENVTSFGLYDGSKEVEQLIEDWHLEGLVRLRNLELVNLNWSTLPDSLFTPTQNLQSIKIISSLFSTLPGSIFFSTPELENINLESNRLESLPNVLFANLSKLANIKLSHNSITEVHPDLFLDIPTLESLDLSHNLISQLDRDAFSALWYLKSLSLRENLLKELPKGIFFKLESLEDLDLGYNMLEALPEKTFDRLRQLEKLNLRNNNLSKLPEEIFQKCISLETLVLAYNNIQALETAMFPMTDSILSYLDLSHNNLSFTPKYSKLLREQRLFSNDFPLSRQTMLKEILLNSNRIDLFPNFGTLFVKLVKVDLSDNVIENLSFYSLIFWEKSVTLNLKNNSIKLIDFHDLYQLLNDKEVKLYLEGNDLQCNCYLYRFSRMVQGKPMRVVDPRLKIEIQDIDTVSCRDHQNNLQLLSEVDTKHLFCYIPDDLCIKTCHCIWQPHDRMFFVNCSYLGLQELPNLERIGNISITLNLNNNSLTSLKGLQDPQYINVVNLTVSNNKISFINESDIPGTLKILDVRGNNITSLSEPLLEYLNATDMVLSFGENPWMCDCDLIYFLNFLHVPSRKVTDFEDIRCANGNDMLLDLTEYSLCPFFMQPMVIVTIVAVAVFLLLFAVLGTSSFYKYKQGIKVWLFAHRMCLWAITEDEMDADKKYDAFISYSHKDEEFVNTVLVPGLESGDPKYRICLHYRDWIPGEYIQNQILQSVEASRRTIVVLSSNFIESVWGQLEFKAAHSQALQDRTNRIIVIVYGAVPPESELDEKLKLYIATKTYVKWGDAKFWEKLRYAMPHPPDLVKKRYRSRKRLDTDKIDLVKSNSKGMA